MNTVLNDEFFNVVGEVFVYMAKTAKDSTDYRRLFFEAIEHFNVSKEYQEAMVEIFTTILSIKLR